MAKKLSKNQKLWFEEVDRIESAIRKMEKIGWIVDKEQVEQFIKKPAKVTKKDISNLRNITYSYIQKNYAYKSKQLAERYFEQNLKKAMKRARSEARVPKRKKSQDNVHSLPAEQIFINNFKDLVHRLLSIDSNYYYHPQSREACERGQELVERSMEKFLAKSYEEQMSIVSEEKVMSLNGVLDALQRPSSSASEIMSAFTEVINIINNGMMSMEELEIAGEMDDLLDTDFHLFDEEDEKNILF